MDIRERGRNIKDRIKRIFKCDIVRRKSVWVEKDTISDFLNFYNCISYTRINFSPPFLLEKKRKSEG